eukprot:9066308-Alexandrium_andersonii.AAC.1
MRGKGMSPRATTCLLRSTPSSLPLGDISLDCSRTEAMRILSPASTGPPAGPAVAANEGPAVGAASDARSSPCWK